MSTLHKLRLEFEHDLANATNARSVAIAAMGIADARISAARDAIDRIDREIRAEKEPKKA